MLTVVQTRRLQGRSALDYLDMTLVAHRQGPPRPHCLQLSERLPICLPRKEDNVRGVCGCPLSGLTPHERLDPTPVIHEFNTLLVGNKEFTNLPHKFKRGQGGPTPKIATDLMYDVPCAQLADALEPLIN